MTLWNRFEQYFKHHQLRLLEKWLALPEMAWQQVEPHRIHNILVVRQHDQLGDFLLSTPVFKALRDQFPHRTITVAARTYTAKLLQHNPHVDHVITFPEHGREWSLHTVVELTRSLWNKYDLAIVLNTVSHSLTSDLIARLCCNTYLLGSDDLLFGETQRNFFYNLTSHPVAGFRHQSERNLDILRPLGITEADRREQIYLTAEEKETARCRLIEQGWDIGRPLVMIHPGAGKPNNRWPVSSFATLARRLQQTHPIQLAVSWGPAEAELGRELIAALDVPVLTAREDDLRKLAALFSQAKLFLCNDTGVMHLAAAVSTPLVAVFGPTDPLQWKPWGDFFLFAHAADGKCASVSVEQVYELSVNLLNNI